ncbi:hypothetical protein QK911_13355 [Lactococcus lactis]
MGADETETIEADIKAEDNHLHNIENNKTVEVWTKFTFQEDKEIRQLYMDLAQLYGN